MQGPHGHFAAGYINEKRVWPHAPHNVVNFGCPYHLVRFRELVARALLRSSIEQSHSGSGPNAALIDLAPHLGRSQNIVFPQTLLLLGPNILGR